MMIRLDAIGTASDEFTDLGVRRLPAPFHSIPVRTCGPRFVRRVGRLTGELADLLENLRDDDTANPAIGWPESPRRQARAVSKGSQRERTGRVYGMIASRRASPQ